VKIDPAALHYQRSPSSPLSITRRSSWEAMDTIARGEIRSSDFITGEVTLEGFRKYFRT